MSGQSLHMRSSFPPSYSTAVPLFLAIVLLLPTALFADTLDDALEALQDGNPCEAFELFREAHDEGLLRPEHELLMEDAEEDCEALEAEPEATSPTRAEIVDEAEDLIADDRYTSAIDLLEEALEVDPDFEEATALINRAEDLREDYLERHRDDDTDDDREWQSVPDGFVLIEGGSFQMGSPSSEPNRDSDETQHWVTITRDFFMQAHEVTQGQWREIMGDNPSSFSSCGSDCPVESVTWYEAVDYANAVSRQQGLEECYRVSGTSVTFDGLDCDGYRLPTEAEWEYAARAGTTTAWHCGSSDSCVSGIAWYSSNSASTTHPVGQKSPNAWGLYDMSGNVWEWVWDWYGSYSTGSVTDPLGASSGQYRVRRGGSWGNLARYVRSAFRGLGAPGLRSNILGLRLARSAP